MKLLKIFIVKIIKTKTSFYTIFELKFFKPSYGQLAGTLIRKYLLKNISSFKVTSVLFFLRNKFSGSSKFYNINEYFPLEEIKEPIENVLLNLRKIVFYNSNFLIRKKFIIGYINASGENYMITGKDIKISELNFKFNLNHYITEIISPNAEMKIIFKIEKKKNISFNPIKTVNFLIKLDSLILAESLVLEMYTNQSTQPFILLKNSLEKLKELESIIN